MEIINAVCANNLLSSIIFNSSCFADILIGLPLLFRYKMNIVYQIQIIIISIYTCVLTIFLPHLWLEPLGSLMKNIPILLLVLFLLSVEHDK